MTAKVLIMAGGTGGHIFPALAVAESCAELGLNVHWLGAERGMEKELLKSSNFPLTLLKVGAVMGGGFLRKLRAPFNVISAVYQANKALSKIRPDVVIGFGGYASGPGAVAAFIKRIPVFIHEQNAVAGFTNRLASKFATVVLQAFENTFAQIKTKSKTTGNPVRIKPIAHVKCEEKIKVLVVGGSSGAASVNELVAKAAETMDSNSIEFWHQCGKGKLEQTKSWYQNVKCEVHLDEFISDMQSAYEWADLVIGRSGASTVSELAVAARPSLLIPYPWHKDRQQFFNAEILVNEGAALVFDQNTESQSDFTNKLNRLITEPNELERMSIAASSIAVIDSANKIAGMLKEFAQAENDENK